jgi:GxxExxY protein
MHENEIGTIIINSSIALHRSLGPGLLERVYEVLLVHKLKEAGLTVRQQVPVPIKFEGVAFDEGFRVDLIVEEKVIIELKSKQEVSASDRKQVQTYLKLTNMRLGYLLNFGAALMKDGIIRAVNGLE